MFKFVTWAIVSVALILGMNYYNTVERPDVSMKVAMSQFNDSNQTAKELRRQTFIQNHINTLAITGWVVFTVLCFYDDAKRMVND